MSLFSIPRLAAAVFLLAASQSATAAQLRPAAASAAAPRGLVARAVAAMGGEQALRGLANVTSDFNNATFALGQEETPGSPARATFAAGRVVGDWRGNRRLQSQELRLVSGAIQRQRRVMANAVGMFENVNVQTGQQARNPETPQALAGVERTMRLQPERLLLNALAGAEGTPPVTLRALPAREWRGEMMDGVRYASGPDTLSLYFDRATGLLTVSESVTDDPILGDRRTVTWYTRWQDAGGVRLPRQQDVEINGRLASHTVITAVSVNAALSDTLFAIPDTLAARAQRANPAPPPVVVQLAELAPGVWRAEGGSHHSLVVEQPRGLIVVEAPLDAARSRAVLDTLRSRFPAKPVTLAVNTHHHWDHAGGLRAYIAAGIPVATHRRNAVFVRGIAAARKSVVPDQLARRPRQPVVRAVGDTMTVGEGDGRVVLYEIPSAHALGILAAYVPSARLLFVSDVLTPGPQLPPAGSSEVAAFVRSRGITVERVAGGHGGVANWADIERAAVAVR